jgi:hypothetical protein
MTTLTRFFVCAVVASGLLAGAVSISPEWFAAANLDFWSLPALHASISESQIRQAELVIEAQRVGDRMQRKQDAVAGLLAGRLSLLEVAARFRNANEPYPESMTAMRNIIPGRTDEERLCRQVIGWAGAAALNHNAPSEAEKLIARLEAELEEHIAKHGRVVLP